MKNSWSPDGAGAKTTYGGRRADAASLFGADGKVSAAIVNRYKTLYRADVAHEVKRDKLILLSSILLFFFTLLPLAYRFVPTFEYLHHTFAVLGLILIIICFIAFRRVKSVVYPNEEYSTFSLVMVGFAFLIVYGACFAWPLSELSMHNFESFTTANFPLPLGYGNGTMDVLPHQYWLFCGIPLILTLVFAIIGYAKGTNRLGAMMSGLICLTGHFMYLTFVDLFFSQWMIDLTSNISFFTENYLYLGYTIGFVALISFDIVMNIIARKIAGKKNPTRIAAGT